MNHSGNRWGRDLGRELRDFYPIRSWILRVIKTSIECHLSTLREGLIKIYVTPRGKRDRIYWTRHFPPTSPECVSPQSSVGREWLVDDIRSEVPSPSKSWKDLSYKTTIHGANRVGFLNGDSLWCKEPFITVLKFSFPISVSDPPFCFIFRYGGRYTRRSKTSIRVEPKLMEEIDSRSTTKVPETG